MYDVIIIGAGVLGGSIFRELTRYKLKVCVLEKENDVAVGTTKANSAIVHAGFDPEPGTSIAIHNVIGNEMYESLCKELSVPFKRNGAMVIAFDKTDLEKIRTLYNNGIKSGIKGIKILNKEEALKMEPNLNSNIVGALYAPTSGIVCPFEYTIALCENAIENGGEIKLNKEVVDIKKENDIFIVKTSDEENIKANYVINAAGVYADKIHDMICPQTFSIRPRKGEYLVLDKSQGNLFSRTIFQCPSKMGKGILVTPTVHGNLMIGPSAVDVDDKDDVSTTPEVLEEIKKVASMTTDKINYKETIKNFAGLRAISSNNNFIVEENFTVKKFIDVAGMKSPGLTCAPSIALEVIDILKNAGLELEKKEKFNNNRKKVRFMDLSADEKNKIIKKDARYGKIVCRCEQITEGEIVEAIKKSFATTSVDSVKRRCRPGMGRCQGGFCSPKVMEIIERECGIHKDKILLDKKGTWILRGKVK